MLMVSVVGLCSGILIASLTYFSLPLGGFFFLLAIVCGCLYGWSPRRLFAAAGIFFLFVSLGGVRMESHTLTRGELSSYVGFNVRVEGVIDSSPDVRETNQRFPLLLSNGEKILVSTDLYQYLSYGDYVRVSGTLKLPEPFETDSGRVFDYTSYLAKDGIGYTISFAKVDGVDEGRGNPIIAYVLSLNTWFQDSVARVLPEPHASLGSGVTVGAKQSLGEELLDDFRATGLSHIVVLSGYNVMIVAEWIMRMLSFLPQVLSIGVGGVAIVLFALLTGGSATVVRASIMSVLALIARATGKTYAVTRALFVAGALMLLHNPYLLLFDPSFQLSFIASLGLIHGSPMVARGIPWVTEKLMIREILSATIATQIAVLPLIIYSFGTVSLVSLPANLFVLPVVPLAMAGTFITALFSWVPIVGFIVAFPAYLLLSYTLFVVQLLSALPLAEVTLPPVPLAVMVMMYAGLFSVYRWLSRSDVQRGTK